LKNTGTIAAVAVTGMAEAVVPIDSRGDPAGPVIPWFDTRSFEEADFVRRQVGEQRVFEMTGLECNPTFSLPKILWTKAHAPDIYKKAVKWLPIVDYVNFRLSGKHVTDYTEACRTLLFDIRSNWWSEEMLALSEIDMGVLPELRQSTSVIGTITPQASMETALPEGVSVVLGGHDHLCGSLAAGLLRGNRVLDSSGTAESIIGLSDLDQKLPEKFEGLRIGRYFDPRRFVTWGGIISSGRSMDWGIETFASLEGWGVKGSAIDYDTVDAAIGEAPAGCRGLLYLSHLRGAGAPYWNPHSRGALVGLRDTHTQAECMRAVMEGLCMEARIIIELTQSVFGSTIRTLSTVGGGACSAVWQQIKADITGREIEIPEVQEATLMGAALLAGIGVGIFADEADASKRTYQIRKKYQPNPDRKATYDEIYAVYRQLYPALLDINAAVTEMNRGR
jgi:xylulokinase